LLLTSTLTISTKYLATPGSPTPCCDFQAVKVKETMNISKLEKNVYQNKIKLSSEQTFLLRSLHNFEKLAIFI